MSGLFLCGRAKQRDAHGVDHEFEIVELAQQWHAELLDFAMDFGFAVRNGEEHHSPVQARHALDKMSVELETGHSRHEHIADYRIGCRRVAQHIEGLEGRVGFDYRVAMLLESQSDHSTDG